jgi:hypothetical protein
MTDKPHVNVCCDGIGCREYLTIEFPDSSGWTGSVDTDSDLHYVYCPNCMLEGEFFGEQCPGCVETFKDCALARAFMFSNKRTITELDLQQIADGVCPFRTNGTFGFSSAGFEALDISSKAGHEAGQAVVKAIKDYMEKYPQE